MKYNKKLTLRDGRSCVLRNGTEQDAEALREIFILTHSQTDFLVDYPDEITLSVEQERQYLRERTESDREIEIVAELDGRIVGSAGMWCIRDRVKLRHRAGFGIGIDRACWGLGIGRALTVACIDCARTAGYSQLELDVFADNDRALALYKSAGFTEFGRNPRGIRLRDSGYHEMVLLRLALDE